MYIGASFKCNEYCQQDDKRKYDKFHSEHRHTIIESDAFKQDNQAFIRKSKRAWNSFSIRLESFFKKLKNELNFIEQEAFNRLEIQQIKSAINTEDKHLQNISIDIVRSRFRNLKCREIDQFLQLRKKHQSLQYINIQREEDNFANDLIEQVNNFFRDISNDLKPKNERKPYNREHQDNRPRKDKEYPKERENRENPRERDNTKKQYPPNRQTKQEPRQRPQRTQKQKNQRPPATQRDQRKNNYQQTKNSRRNEQKFERGQKRQEPKDTRRYERDEFRNRDRKNLRQREEPPQQNKKGFRNNPKEESSNKEKEACPLVKVEELNSSSNAFDIDLKIISFVKNIYGKQMWRASDQTGQIMLVLPTHNAVKDGAKITMHNCYAKLYNQKLEIYTKINSKISYKNVKQQAFELPQYQKKHGEREDRNRERNKQKGLAKIEAITPDYENFKLIGKVVSVRTLKQQDYECVLGDQTGVVNAKFHGYDEFIKVGKIVYFRGLDVQVDDCGHMFVTGNKVLMELAHDEVKSVNTANNISERQYQLVE